MASNTKSGKTAKKATNGTVGVNVNLPVAVHRRLRVKAINNDLSMTQAITEAVAQWVKAS